MLKTPTTAGTVLTKKITKVTPEANIMNSTHELQSIEHL